MSDLRETLPTLWGGEILWDCSMAQFSTIRAGGPAAAVVKPGSMDELVRLIKGLAASGFKWQVVGGGSNILVVDEGFDGVIVLLGRSFGAVAGPEEVGDEIHVTVEAGCSLARLVKWCAEQELAGLEFAAGIPGTVGGAVVMNAGAWGKEMAELVTAVTVIDRQGNMETRCRREIPFTYRSWGGGELVVATATLRLVKGRRQEIEAVCRELAAKRQATQPLGEPSAGSFFTNPAGQAAAGRLIEQAGLKGYRVGGAMVSPKHANFLVNAGQATAGDFLDLMKVVQEKVQAMSKVWLEPEVRIIGNRQQEEHTL